jgi:hypothetical protein
MRRAREIRRAGKEVFAMTETASKPQIFLANLAIVLVIAFCVIGLAWYGFSAEVRQRFWEDLLERPGGPMTFRFILQPIMAAFAALHDGMKDATSDRSPYLWTILVDSKERGGRLREGLIATARVILLGLCMDVIYQLVVLKTFYPGEAAIVAIMLAFVPYLILRGPVARIVRWRHGNIRTSERQ